MRRTLTVSLGIGILIALMLSGCAKHFVITDSLEAPLERPAYFVVGEITDGLPLDMEEGKKPSSEDINKLKNYLHAELLNRKFLSERILGAEGTEYQVVGSFVEYKKGSGVVRALIGFGLGSARASISLQLIDTETGEVIFGGMFKGTVSDWGESGEKMFRRISKDFSKELEKQMKKLSKG